MAYASLLGRMEGFEARLSRVEAALALPAPGEADAPESVEQPHVPERPHDPEPADEPEPIPLRAVFDVSPVAGAYSSSVPRWGERWAAASAEREAEPAEHVPQPAIAYARPDPVVARPAPLRHASLEQAIGLKVAGWAGAVAMVAGVGWAIQWAYVNGYFAVVPPTVRLALLALVGGALIGAGEWVYRRVHALSATGLFGAGVAVLFVASYAGHAYYELYGSNAAFALLAASTAIGAAVARRGNLVTIAVLSLIGGNLAPLLVGSGTPPAGPFLFYLVMLQVVALTLAWLGREPKWWALRGLSLATTSVWVAAVIQMPTVVASHWTPVLLLTYAILFQAEVIASAPRERVGSVTPAASGAVRVEYGTSAVFSLLVTAGLVAALLARFADAGTPIRVASVLGVAAGAATLSALCARRRRPSTHLLAVGYVVQATALLVVAVPIAVGGAWVAIGWAGLAMAFAVMGRVLNLRPANLAAPAVWGLAVLDLICWTNGALGASHVGDVAMTLAGVSVPIYAVMAWGLAITGHSIARVTASAGERPAAQLVSAMAGTVLVIASLAALPPLAATVVLLTYALAVVTNGSLGGGSWLVPQAAAVVVLVTAKWLVVDTVTDRLWGPQSIGTGLVDPAAVVGLVVAAAVWGTYVIRDRWLPALGQSSAWQASPRFSDRLFAGAALVVAVVLAWAGSVEAVRAVAVLLPAGTGFSAGQWTQLSITVCWATAIGGYLASTAWPATVPVSRRATAVHLVAILPTLLAVKFAIVDAGGLALLGAAAGRGAPLLNPRAVAAAAVLSVLVVQRIAAGRASIAADSPARLLPVGTAVLLALVAGTFEVHQACAWLGLSGSGGLAEGVAVSIFWATFAVASISAGFQLRVAGLRYFGLSLFAVTLLKVLFVDLGRVDSGGRVLSFLAVGLLLLGTSVLYGKVSPKLLADGPVGEEGRNPSLGGQ